MMYRCLAALLSLSLLCTCGPSPEKNASATSTAVSDAYPSIPVERLEYLFENATYMDATFYDLPISINQSELAQIQATIGGIAQATMSLDAGCKPIGHIWFQVNGKNVEEADIYYDQNCVGYVWYENGQPAYSNMMTEQGFAFYGNIFQSVKSQTEGQQ